MSRYRERNYSFSVPFGQLTESKRSQYVNNVEEAENGESEISFDPLTGPSQTVTYKDTMNDAITPNFYSIIKNGGPLPVNGMSGERYTGNPKIISVTTVDRLVTHSDYGGVVVSTRTDVKRTHFYHSALPSGSVPLPPGTEQRLINAAGARMQNGFMDVLTTASELHKTVELVRGFRRRVIKQLGSFAQKADTLVKSLKSRNGSSKMHAREAARELARVSSSFWLEWRFGWRLLIYDYNSIVRVASEAKPGFVSKRFYESDQASNDTVTEFFDGYHTVTRTTYRELKARAMVRGTVNKLLPVKIDPLSTLWELIPLSFVIDMFWNIGDVIATHSPMRMVESDAVSFSTIETLTSTIDVTPGSPPEGYTRLHTKVESSGDGFTLVRKHRKRSQEKFRFSAKIDLNAGRATDLAALTVALSKQLTKLGKSLRFLLPARKP